MATSFELTSISCKGVKSLVPFPKPSLYAVIFISNLDIKPQQNHKKKTSVDRVSGENPDWDQPIGLDLHGLDPDLLLEFNIKADGIFRNRLVGKVRIPFTDFNLSGSVCHVSYQVRTPDGKPNGVLNFSYTIDGKPSDNHPLPSKPSLPVSYPPAAPASCGLLSLGTGSAGLVPFTTARCRLLSFGAGTRTGGLVPSGLLSSARRWIRAVSLYPSVPAASEYYPAPMPVYESYPPPPTPACAILRWINMVTAIATRVCMGSTERNVHEQLVIRNACSGLVPPSTVLEVEGITF